MSDSKGPTLLSRVRESRDTVRLADGLRAPQIPQHTVSLYRKVIEVEVTIDGTGSVSDFIAVRLGVVSSAGTPCLCELQLDRTHWELIKAEVDSVLATHGSNTVKKEGE